MSELRLLRSFETLECTPSMIKESLEKNDGKIIVHGILQKADTLNQNGRIYPKAILEREVRNYQKFINENRSLGECVPPGTEIFTRDGWKNIEDISDDEIIATLNVETNELEYQRITRKIDLPYEGKMYRFKNARTFDMCLTAEHNVLLWDRHNRPYKMKASELHDRMLFNDSRVSHSGLKRAGCVWKGEDVDVVNVADKTIDSALWAAFLGIYLAEGYSSGVYAENRKEEHVVALTQNEGDVAEQIRILLDQLPWSWSEKKSEGLRRDFFIVDQALHASLFDLGGSRDKYVPMYAKAWSSRLLNVLLEWMLLGDGRHRRGYEGKMIDEYCTSSKRLADDVYELMLKLGDGATIHQFEPTERRAPDYQSTGRMILAENQVPMNIVSRHSSSGMSCDKRFIRMEEFDYVGRVYCVTVPNGTWLMRYNDKVVWTSNCDHPDSSVVSLKNVSHIIREAYMEGNEVRGRIEILDKLPSGAILKGLIESGVKLGISSRGVGSTKKQGEYQVVQDDFQLITFDAVSEPSTPGAFLIPEGKVITTAELRQLFTRSDRIDRVLNEILFNV